MIDDEEVLSIAVRFLEENFQDPDLVEVVRDGIRRRGYLVGVPYNSREFLRTGDMRHALMGNLPLLVDGSTGLCRFMTRDELDSFYPV
jgi:hypothetical protein